MFTVKVMLNEGSHLFHFTSRESRLSMSHLQLPVVNGSRTFVDFCIMSLILSNKQWLGNNERRSPCEEGFATDKSTEEIDAMCRAVVEEELVELVDIRVLLRRDLGSPESALEGRLLDRGWHQLLNLPPGDRVQAPAGAVVHLGKIVRGKKIP